MVSIPTDVDPAAYAPLLCAGGTVFNALRQQKIFPGSIVAIQGLGGLGHLALQYAANMGYRVVALSSSGSKEKFAKDLGAHDYLDGSKVDHAEELQKWGGASMIVATAPNTDIMKGLIGGLEAGGKLLVLAGEFSFFAQLHLISLAMLPPLWVLLLNPKKEQRRAIWSAQARIPTQHIHSWVFSTLKLQPLNPYRDHVYALY